MPNRPMPIFPKLLKSGNVFCCRSGLVVFFDAHSIETTSTFITMTSQIKIVIVLKIPTNAKSRYSGSPAVLTATENPIKRMV